MNEMDTSRTLRLLFLNGKEGTTLLTFWELTC